VCCVALLAMAMICELPLGSSAIEVHSGSGVGDWIVVSDDVTLQVVGHSGKIKLYTTTSDGTNSVEVSFDKLYEVNRQGDWQQKSSSLASTDFEWSQPEMREENGVNYTRVNLTTEIRVIGSHGGTYVPFKCELRLYLDTGNVTFDNETYTVHRDHVKFTLHLGSWPFLSNENSLQFGLLLKAKDSSAGVKSIQDHPDDHRQKRIALGAVGVFDLVNSALADGQTVPINATLYNQGAFNGVELLFPYYRDTLDYDPTIGLNSGGGEPVEPSGLGAIAIVGIVLGSLVGVAIVAYICNRVRNTQAAKSRAPAPAKPTQTTPDHNSPLVVHYTAMDGAPKRT